MKTKDNITKSEWQAFWDFFRKIYHNNKIKYSSKRQYLAICYGTWKIVQKKDKQLLFYIPIPTLEEAQQTSFNDQLIANAIEILGIEGI
jgi:hypothetical protein